MNHSQKSMLRSIVEKCSHDETEFLLEQFEHARGVAKEANNPWKHEDYGEALDVIRDQSQTHD